MAIVEPLTPEQLQKEILAFVEAAKAKAKGGLTVAEFGELTVAILRLAVHGLESIPTDGASKKAWALQAVACLFDAVADSCIPLPAKPAWWVIRPAVRSLVLSAAAGALEQVLTLVRSSSEPTVILPPEAKS